MLSVFRRRPRLRFHFVVQGDRKTRHHYLAGHRMVQFAQVAIELRLLAPQQPLVVNDLCYEQVDRNLQF
jgi:hypothetical protein